MTTGGESTPEDIAARIFDAISEGRALLLPAAYARTMKRRVGAEFQIKEPQ